MPVFRESAMITRLRQKTCASDKACVAMLCMATTMLLGFSKPRNDTQAEPAYDNVQQFYSGHGTVAQYGYTEYGSGLREVSRNLNSIRLPGERPKTMTTSDGAGKYTWVPLLGGVDSHAWSHDSTAELALVTQSQTYSPSGIFYGVGFPDIRTYQRARRSPFAPPEPWTPMVTWRPLSDENVEQEPIARVRCMGLTPHAVARRADRYTDLIYAYAEQYAISAQLVKAVIAVESCFNNKALSRVGAQGLMQLMPDTARWLKVKDPHDPAQNLRGGVKYLAALLKEFERLELVLAAYNAGPGNVRRYNGIPPFAETRAYVSKVQANYRRYKAAKSLLDPPTETENGLLQESDELTLAEINSATPPDKNDLKPVGP